MRIKKINVFKQLFLTILFGGQGVLHAQTYQESIDMGDYARAALLKNTVDKTLYRFYCPDSANVDSIVKLYNEDLRIDPEVVLRSCGEPFWIVYKENLCSNDMGDSICLAAINHFYGKHEAALYAKAYRSKLFSKDVIQEIKENKKEFCSTKEAQSCRRSCIIFSEIQYAGTKTQMSARLKQEQIDRCMEKPYKIVEITEKKKIKNPFWRVQMGRLARTLDNGLYDVEREISQNTKDGLFFFQQILKKRNDIEPMAAFQSENLKSDLNKTFEYKSRFYRAILHACRIDTSIQSHIQLLVNNKNATCSEILKNYSMTEFEDKRNGKMYETELGEYEIWMSHNLNYSADSDIGLCYKDDSNCEGGRYYSWEEVKLQADSTSSSICPDGWELPSKNMNGLNNDKGKILDVDEEWKELERQPVWMREGVFRLDIYNWRTRYNLRYYEGIDTTETTSETTSEKGVYLPVRCVKSVIPGFKL